MAFEIRAEPVEPGRVLRCTVDWRGDRAVCRGELVALLRDDGALRDALTACLRDAPFDAFFWETPPLTIGNADLPAEFVIADSPALARAVADPRPFAAHLEPGEGTDGVATFDNLGGDAVLVAPYACAGLHVYGHLASFVRGAPGAQVHALWREVGSVAARLIGSAPLWISTSGLGVYWLHVRVERTPKYYTHAPYRSA